MGKRLIIQGVDYTNSAIGAVTPEEPDTPVVPDVPDYPDVLSVQTIEPSLQDIASATTLVNYTIAIGSSRNPAQGGGYLRSVTSAVTGKYIRIVIVGADLNVISISDDIYLSEATTNIRNLNIYIPYGGYVAYTNSETEQAGAITYINTGGQPHLEVSASIGATANLNKFPTMRLALGCEIEITESAGGGGSEEEPDTPVEPDEPTTPDEPDVTYEYQTIQPSSDATSAFLNATAFLGHSEVTATRGGYINAILCAFDGAYSMRVCVVDGTTNEVLSVSEDITQTNQRTDVRSLNIYVPAGARIGFGNGSGTKGALKFTTASGTKHFEVTTGAVGATANLNKFPTMQLSLGCEIELENV